jgi:PAS domain S-box-containing protein
MKATRSLRRPIFPILFYLFFFVLDLAGQTMLAPVNLSRIKPGRLDYVFEKVRTLSNDQYTPVDLDGDGEDEFIITSESDSGNGRSGYVIIEDIENQQTSGEKMFSGNFAVSPLHCDIDGDGFKEIFVGESLGDTAYFNVLDHKGKRILKIPCAVNPKRTLRPWICLLTAETSMDISGDGFPDLLIFMNTGEAYQPRGVIALDVRQKKILWKQHTGFNPQTMLLYNADSDGKREIILGSASPDNGEDAFGRDFLVNGTDDRLVYTAVLDSAGKWFKRAEAGGVFSELLLSLHELDRRKGPEIIVQFIRSSSATEANYFGLWDPSAGNMKPQPLLQMEKQPVKGMAFLDADRNGEDDVLIGWKDGTLEIRDRRFDVLRTRQFPGFDIRTIMTVDLDNNGETEIVASGVFRDRYSGLVLNRFLDILAWEHTNTGFQGVFNPGFGKEKLLLVRAYSEPGGVALVRMKKQSRTILPEIGLGWLGAGFTAGMLAAWAWLVYRSRKRVEEIKAWVFKTMIDSERIPAFLLDQNGRILATNREAEHFFNIPENHILAQPYGKLFSNGNWGPVHERIDAFIRDGEIQIQQELTLASRGNQKDLLLFISAVLLDSSGRTGTMTRIQDVTELTQSKRAVAWASMAQKLAHEIKTPLSTVMLSAQHLQMECERGVEGWKEGPKYVERIVRQVGRLQKMTDAFLKFSRIEKPRLESCDTNAMIEGYIKENQYKIGSDVKIIKTLTEALPSIQADRQQVVLVLQNLIDNGLNAMEGKGVITITTRLVQSLQSVTAGKNASAVQIEISDTGKGMSKEDIDRLFQPFFSKSPGGTGLGLVIVKKIVEDHNGDIRYSSEIGNGTTVTVTLPEKP